MPWCREAEGYLDCAMLHKQIGYSYILQELEQYKLNKIASFMINIYSILSEDGDTVPIYYF